MTNFVIMTDTPGRLAAFLVSRNIIKQNPDGSYIGVLPGMEWVEVPNPIQIDPGSGTLGQPGYIPPTYDTRKCYLVKFSHESLADDTEDIGDSPLDPWQSSKFADWVRNNSTVVSAPAGWTVYGEPAGDAWKINGQNVWLVRFRPERFGVWQ